MGAYLAIVIVNGALVGVVDLLDLSVDIPFELAQFALELTGAYAPGHLLSFTRDGPIARSQRLSIRSYVPIPENSSLTLRQLS